MKIRRIHLASFGKTVAWVAILASVGNSALAFVGKLLSNPPKTFGPYMYSSVVGLTVGGVIGAGVVYAALRYYIPSSAKANRYFMIISAVVLVVSFYPDVTMPWSTDTDQVGWTYGIIANLMLMHVLAAGLVVRYFPLRFQK